MLVHDPVFVILARNLRRRCAAWESMIWYFCYIRRCCGGEGSRSSVSEGWRCFACGEDLVVAPDFHVARTSPSSQTHRRSYPFHDTSSQSSQVTKDAPQRRLPRVFCPLPIVFFSAAGHDRGRPYLASLVDAPPNPAQQPEPLKTCRVKPHALQVARAKKKRTLQKPFSLEPQAQDSGPTYYSEISPINWKRPCPTNPLRFHVFQVDLDLEPREFLGLFTTFVVFASVSQETCGRRPPGVTHEVLPCLQLTAHRGCTMPPALHPGRPGNRQQAEGSNRTAAQGHSCAP